MVSNSPQDTFAAGQKIALRLVEGSVVALEGTLGSGKTQLAKGIANGLGINENLTSPTYTIINEYKTDGKPPLYHIDAYRLNNDEDFEGVGGDEIIRCGGISVIEWSGRIPKSIPDDAITVCMEITGPSSRLIKIGGLENL